MNDLRLDRLEASLRRLRMAVFILGAALVGVISMAAAPTQPADLKVHRLFASEIVLEQGKDKLSLQPGGLRLSGNDASAELSATTLRLANARVEATASVSENSAVVSVTTLDKTKLPSAATLTVNAVPRQIPTPFVDVSDGERHVSLMATGLLPPPKP